MLKLEIAMPNVENIDRFMAWYCIKRITLTSVFVSHWRLVHKLACDEDNVETKPAVAAFW